MKIWLVAILAAAIGLAIGVGSTVAEFWNAREEFHTRSLERTKGKDYATTATGSGRAVILNGDRYDFGVMERNVKRSHTFQIKNEGPGPLTIKVGHTTCKCTVADLDKAALAPGETTNVKLEWEAKGYEDVFTQSAELTTSDTEHPVIRLTVIGRISQAVRPEPEEFSIASLTAGTDFKRTIRLYGYQPDKELEVLTHTFENPDHVDHFELAVTPLPREQWQRVRNVTGAVDLTLTIKSGLPIGPISQTLRITTNMTDEPLEIPVRGAVASDFSLVHAGGAKGFLADKNLVTLGKLKPGQGAKVNLFLLVKGPHRDETEVTLGEIDPANVLKVTLGERSKLNENVVKYPVEVVIPADAPNLNRQGGEYGEFGKIVFTTTHPVAKEVRLYVQFAIED